MAIPRTSYWSISNRSWNLGYQGVSSCRSTTTRNTLNSGCTSTVISCWCHQLLCGVFQTAAYGENLQICTPNFKTEADVVTYPSWCPHPFLALYMPPPKKSSPPKAVPRHTRPVTSWKGLVEISCPAPATPAMMLSPQPLWHASRAARWNIQLVNFFLLNNIWQIHKRNFSPWSAHCRCTRKSSPRRRRWAPPGPH